MKAGRFLLLFALSTLPAIASADRMLERKTVKSIFAEGSSTAGFYTVEGLPQCKYSLMYIDMKSGDGSPKESGRAWLSLVLAAKSAGWEITRMDYTVDGGGACHLTGLHVE